MTPLEILNARRDVLLGQIAVIVNKGPSASDSEKALLKMYRRQLMSVNEQIIVLVNTPPPEPEPEDVLDIPF